MRTKLCAALVVAVAAAVNGQTPAAPAGTWVAEATPPDQGWTAALRVHGRRLVGVVSQCASQDGEFEIRQGLIDGNTVTFRCSNANGNRTVTFTGTIDGDEIRFTWERIGPAGANRFFADNAPRQFTARRVADTLNPALAAAADRIPMDRGVTFDRILRADQEPHNWLTYSGNLAGARHSPLTHITTSNVQDLELAWLWQAPSPWDIEATALVVDGVLYTVHVNDVVALDAVTGRVLWTHPYAAPADARATGGDGRPNRGLAILGDSLFMGTLDGRLRSIHADSGKLLWEVTVADPAERICRPQVAACYANITLAPLVVKDKVIVGTAGGDSDVAGYGMRGAIAAFDAASGEQAWRFSTVPGPGQPGHETWSGDSWKVGGAGVWVTGSYDPDLNLTYWGTGNPSPVGVYGPPLANTRLGDNLYSASVVALDADTGALKWHYQFTPHDDMDWDAAQVPVLADMPWQGRTRKVMLFANKNGLMYVLDRATGEFLMGKPFVDVNWTSGFDDRGRPIRVPGKISGPEGTRVTPGSATNWFPAAYSPRTSLLYVPATENAREGGLIVARQGYGAIRAIDPTSGERKWEFRIDAAQFTGMLSTGSDLLFAGVTADSRADPQAARLADRYFHALDARTGQLLWRRTLARPVRSGPMSYAVAGQQFVTVAAGNTLYAFALRQ